MIENIADIKDIIEMARTYAESQTKADQLEAEARSAKETLQSKLENSGMTHDAAYVFPALGRVVVASARRVTIHVGTRQSKQGGKQDITRTAYRFVVTAPTLLYLDSRRGPEEKPPA